MVFVRLPTSNQDDFRNLAGGSLVINIPGLKTWIKPACSGIIARNSYWQQKISTSPAVIKS